MEIILVIIGYFLLVGGWRLIAPAFRATQGGGSFRENMSAELHGMGPLEIRKVDFQLDGEDGAKGIAIEIKGIIPVTSPLNLGFITSVVDFTDEDNSQPVLCEIEQFQEPNSTAYCHIQDAGRIEPNQGYTRWVRVGIVFPSLLYPAYGGKRKLGIVTRFVDMDNPPDINLGYSSKDHPGFIHREFLTYDLDYSGKGFLEAVEHRDEARSLAIRLGMAVAVADGSLDDAEGVVIKKWVTRTIAPFGGEKRESLKSLYNDAMRNAYADANKDQLVLSEVTSRLHEIAEKPQKYEAIELCFDVMAADGIADESELDMIRKIAEALELDYEEISLMRDKRIIELDVGLENQASLETIIGLQADWSQDKIKVHIRKEYAKWNDRLSHLPEGQERENAQRMLDILSEARKKYA